MEKKQETLNKREEFQEFSVEATNIDEEENAKEETDIRDIEFKLMHNLDELQVKKKKVIQ